MNVSASPPIKPPHTLDGAVTASRPTRPASGRNGGAIDARPLPPVTAPTPNPKTPRMERPAVADAPAAADDAPDSMFNVDGLLADWGRNADSPYDLDGSGEVDGWDLALFLGGQQPRAGEPELNVQGLIDQWGESNSPYDIDGNGTVDGWDLALFLGGEQPSANASASNSTSNVVGEDAPPADAAAAGDTSAADKLRFSDPEKFLNRFTKAVFRGAGIKPGDQIPIDQLKLTDEELAHLDADGDGFVKPRELRDLIQKEIAGQLEPGSGFRPKPALEEWIARIGGEQNEALVSRSGKEAPSRTDRREALARLTNFVSEKLDGAGFAEHPPRNIHAVLARLDLSGSERGFLLSQLANKYPNGLGVNRVG